MSPTTSFRSLSFSLYASSTPTPISQPIRIIHLLNSCNRFYGLSFSSSSSLTSSLNLVFSSRKKQSLSIKRDVSCFEFCRHRDDYISPVSKSSHFITLIETKFALHPIVLSFGRLLDDNLDSWWGVLRAIFLVQALAAETEQPKWWEKKAGPNMIDITSTQQFLNALKDAGDRLVIVDFYATWCGSCRAMFPKLCKTAEEHPEIFFLKVNFDENKSLCKSLNVKVLPYFHFYRGADGQVDSFSCSLAKFQKLREAIGRHNGGISSDPSSSVSEKVEDSTSSV